MQCRRRQATLHGLPELPLRQTQVIRSGVHNIEDFDVIVPLGVVQVGVEVTRLRSDQPLLLLGSSLRPFDCHSQDSREQQLGATPQVGNAHLVPITVQAAWVRPGLLHKLLM